MLFYLLKEFRRSRAVYVSSSCISNCTLFLERCLLRFLMQSSPDATSIMPFGFFWLIDLFLTKLEDYDFVTLDWL